MIKIISGYSHAAGSTLALVNLCNEFDSRGHACTLYGPDNWHTDKCRSGSLVDFSAESGDIVIVNDIPLQSSADLVSLQELIDASGKKGLLKALGRFLRGCLPAEKRGDLRLILTRLNHSALPCMRLSLFQKVHFSNSELGGHSRTRPPKFVVPSICHDLKRSGQKPEKIAGIIGSIKRQNRIETALEQALQDGMETVIIFGYMEDPIYYFEMIAPLTLEHRGRIQYAGFIDNRQQIYDAISDVYASVRKPWSVVSHECAMTGTGYHAPDAAMLVGRMSNEQILRIWENELAL